MFSAVGLFKHVRCPRTHDCSLPYCFFEHSSVSQELSETDKAAQEYDPFSVGEISAPASKRRKLEHPSSDEDSDEGLPIQINSVNESPRKPLKQAPGADIALPKAESETLVRAKVPNATTSAPSDARVSTTKTVSATNPASRPITPPVVRTGKPSAAQAPSTVVVKSEPLIPRNVARAAAVLKTRISALQGLHQQMTLQNKKIASAGEKLAPMVLRDQELITMALEEEEKAATTAATDIYRNTMAHSILRVKKMTLDDWVKHVATWTGAASKAENKAEKAEEKAIQSGLATPLQEIAVLKHLRTSLDGLEQHGYVTAPVSQADIDAAKAAVDAAAGFERCDRCGTRFQVFPGRDEKGRLTSHGECRYHWARVSRPTKMKTEKTFGHSDATYPCCNKVQGSEGCTEAATHVFDAKDPKRLASILQFEPTPEKLAIRGTVPVSFDCEMAYTTLGMEVVRLTAVTWPKGELLVDVLVRPYGEILDLNTRFSGVTKEAYANATSLDTSKPDAAKGEIGLGKVDSPAAARQLLFDHLTPETPLIGHAINNDLNVCRIIHPFVIDTVLLYPHPRGLPFRFGLKMLSETHLSRNIQGGGDAGHDSKEDAVATGDLVTVKVAEKWKLMRNQGWKFSEGLLVSPEETV